MYVYLYLPYLCFFRFHLHMTSFTRPIQMERFQRKNTWRKKWWGKKIVYITVFYFSSPNTRVTSENCILHRCTGPAAGRVLVPSLWRRQQRSTKLLRIHAVGFFLPPCIYSCLVSIHVVSLFSIFCRLILSCLYINIQGLEHEISWKCHNKKNSSISDECANKAKCKPILAEIGFLDIHRKICTLYNYILAILLKVGLE